MEGEHRPRRGVKRRVSQSCYKVLNRATVHARRPRGAGPLLPVATGRRPRGDGCRVRHPSMPAASMRSPHASTAPTPVGLLRYLDLVLVVAALPFVVFAGLPLLGYAVGAGAWFLQRGIGVFLERRAARSQDMRRQVGLNFFGTLARSWLVGGAILAVGLLSERQDGLTAAVLVLVAFTVYFAVTLAVNTVGRRLW